MSRITACLVASLSFALISVSGAAAADALPPISDRFAAAGHTEDVDFQRHLVPLLGKLGCNGRACHGSFQGRGGFQLSLFGYDFDKDQKGLEERSDLEDVAASYLLHKATNVEEHEGGERMKVDSWEYRVFHDWIKQGAEGVQAPSTLAKLQVEPAELKFNNKGESVQFKVTAIWDDGSVEDVTPLCRFDSNDDQIAAVTEGGLVTAVEPGDTHVVVFYDNGITPVPVLQPVSEFTGDRYPAVETPTKVDELVVEKLRKIGVIPSEQADDTMFLRRVSLDMTGTLPTSHDIRTFVADTDPNKRARKIEELIASPAFSAWWATWLCDITGNSVDKLNNVGLTSQVTAEQWYEWTRDRVAENRPYDQIVRGLVMATSRQPGEDYRAYCERASDEYRAGELSNDSSMPWFWARQNFKLPEERAIGFAYTFLGIRIQCAQCHKHPFDQWTQDDFEGFQQFFTTVRYNQNGGSESGDREVYNELIAALKIDDDLKGNQLRRELVPALRKGATVPFPEVSVVAVKEQRKPKNFDKLNEKQKQKFQSRLKTVRGRVLGGDDISLSEYDDPREPVMNWMLDDAKDLFARAFVNRVWGHYFGRGIVEPTDDLSLANPPSNEPLMNYLADGFIASGYDMQWVHRTIVNSRTYQTSWKPNETNKLDEKNFARSLIRRLPAEVMVDAVAQATAASKPNELFLVATDDRATAEAVRGANTIRSNYALGVFGASIRESNCDCDRSNEPSLLQTVYLQNDSEMLKSMTRKNDGWLAEIAQQWKQPFAGSANNATGNRKQQFKPLDYDERVEKFEELIAAAKKSNKTDKVKQYKKALSKYVERYENLPMSPEAAETKREEIASQPKSAVPADEIANVVEEAYLRTLSRKPTDDERSVAVEAIQQAQSPMDGIHDVLWALVNTKEFVVNH